MAACADTLIERLGGNVVLALPLGLGKANRLANALFRRAAADRNIRLRITTALTLARPRPQSSLEQRFLGPIVERVFGDYPELDYLAAVRSNALPPNVEVSEFYLAPGALLGAECAQRHYVSSNYSQVVDHLCRAGVNVIAQIVAPDTEGTRLSLSCNPDVTIDLLAARRDCLLVGEVNRRLPWMDGRAALPRSRFDLLLDDGTEGFTLPGPIERPVSLTQHAIGLNAATWVRDGGTLQIGIGALGDAVVHALALRHTRNDRFRALLQALDQPGGDCSDTFSRGLYGASEMLVEGFLQLRKHGVLRRTVAGDDGREVWLHAGFFLGSPRFYRALRALSEAERSGIAMMPISFTNTLDDDPHRKSSDRQLATFVNSAMMATLSGAVVSDGLEDGRVVSGVGGQFDFVVQAHKLPGGRSLLMLPSTRASSGRVTSNIVHHYGHVTIPRHLRDVVITEYGSADLRGVDDRGVIERLLAVADSRFQGQLLEHAKRVGKIERDYVVPDRFRDNTPERIRDALQSGHGLLPHYPLGSELTDVEQRLALAFEALGSARGRPWQMLKLIGAGRSAPTYHAELERLQVDAFPFFERILTRQLVRGALARSADDRPLSAAALWS